MKKYRVVEFYHNFFAHNGYKLQVLEKFWRWSWWNTVEVDNLGLRGQDWADHYDCKIIKKEAE